MGDREGSKALRSHREREELIPRKDLMKVMILRDDLVRAIKVMVSRFFHVPVVGL